MSSLFDFIAARREPESYEDAPQTEPMRPQGADRRNPSTDEKKTRRQLQMNKQAYTHNQWQELVVTFHRATGEHLSINTLAENAARAVLDQTNNVVSAVMAGAQAMGRSVSQMEVLMAHDGVMDVVNATASTKESVMPTKNDRDEERAGPWESGEGDYPFADELYDLTNPYEGEDPYEDYDPYEASRNTVEREAKLLRALGKATTEEQQVILAELDELRAGKTAAIENERSLALADTYIDRTFAPVSVHALNTSGTDWLGSIATESSLDGDETVEHKVRAEATLWFRRTSAEVKADREEFAAQAVGMARRTASLLGDVTGRAQQTFLDTVTHLHRTAGDNDQQRDSLEERSQEADANDWGLQAPPGEVEPKNWPITSPEGETTTAYDKDVEDLERSQRRMESSFTGDLWDFVASPTSADPSGQGKSSLPLGVTPGNAPEVFDNFAPEVAAVNADIDPEDESSLRAPMIQENKQEEVVQASVKTASWYCNTHEVYVGDGNRDTHAGCKLEQRKSTDSAIHTADDRPKCETCGSPLFKGDDGKWAHTYDEGPMEREPNHEAKPVTEKTSSTDDLIFQAGLDSVFSRLFEAGNPKSDGKPGEIADPSGQGVSSLPDPDDESVMWPWEIDERKASKVALKDGDEATCHCGRKIVVHDHAWYHLNSDGPIDWESHGPQTYPGKKESARTAAAVTVTDGNPSDKKFVLPAVADRGDRADLILSPTYAETFSSVESAITTFMERARANGEPATLTVYRRGVTASRTAAEGQTCEVCGDSIEHDPSSEDPSTYHHNNGEKHDHEAKPAAKESSRHQAGGLENLGDDRAEPFTKEDGEDEDDKKESSKVAASDEFQCQECDKLFKKKIGPNTHEVKCPKCGSYDTLPTAYFGRNGSLHTAAEPIADPSGQAQSQLPQADSTEDEDYVWPWELDEDGKHKNKGAADVANVATPGGSAGYPQPTASRHEAIYCTRCKGQQVVNQGGAWVNCPKCKGTGVDTKTRKEIDRDLGEDFLGDHTGSQAASKKCRECGKDMNPVDALVGGGTGKEPICNDCVEKKQKQSAFRQTVQANLAQRA